MLYVQSMAIEAPDAYNTQEPVKSDEGEEGASACNQTEEKYCEAPNQQDDSLGSQPTGVEESAGTSKAHNEKRENETGADITSAEPTKLHYSRKCCICGLPYFELHRFYDKVWDRHESRMSRCAVAAVYGSRMLGMLEDILCTISITWLQQWNSTPLGYRCARSVATSTL